VPSGTTSAPETAIAQGLAAAVYVVSHHTVREGELPIGLFVELCRAGGVPVIVDMAAEYDLRSAIGVGADAVIWSGHKFLGGPTSGIVAGRRPMIRAMYLQNRGLGRMMKAGKEAVAGAIAALDAWAGRDHAAEAAREAAIVAAWMEDLAGLPGIGLSRHADWTGNPVTRLCLTIDPGAAGLNAWELAARCLAGRPAVALRDDLAMHQLIFLDPCNLTATEAVQVAARIRAVCTAARHDGDGRRQSWDDAKRARGSVALPWLDGDG
jgi:L-seryl-tRNA(Ser) seleniumtransferase